MRTTLVIVATEERANMLRSTIPDIKRQMNMCQIEFYETVFLERETLSRSLPKYLEKSTVIMADFDYTDVLDCINSVLSQRYHSSLNNISCGKFISNEAGESCLVLNIALEVSQMLDLNLLCSIYNVPDIILYVKLFGLDKSRIFEILDAIPGRQGFHCTIYTALMESELCISAKPGTSGEVINEFVRCVYENLGEYIFSDDQSDMLSKVDELLTLRRATVAVADGLTCGMLENMLRDGLPNYEKHFIENMTLYEDEDYSEKLKISSSYIKTHGLENIELAYEMADSLITHTNTDIALALCGTADHPFVAVGDRQAIHVYKFNFRHDPEYIFKLMPRITIYKLLKKLRENDLFFLENSV